MTADTEPTSRWACDTSVAVAAVDPNHEAHGPCRRAVLDRRPALAGHAAFEAYAVLTRLPVPLRVGGVQAADLLHRTFPDGCWLDRKLQSRLLPKLAELGIVGGSVYDALVGQAAAINGRVLLTRDRRAERTYRALEVNYSFVS